MVEEKKLPEEPTAEEEKNAEEKKSSEEREKVTVSPLNALPYASASDTFPAHSPPWRTP